MFHHIDCLSVILSYLCYVDQLSLKLTCHNPIVLNFKAILIKRLLQHRIVPNTILANVFCDHLHKTGAYIAGSFILDCLYDTNHHNDIDIYDQTTLGYDGIEDWFGYGNPNSNLLFTQELYNMGFIANHNTS